MLGMQIKKAEEIYDLLSEKRYGSFYVLARYFYRVGEPIVSDAFYESLQGELMKAGAGPALQQYFDRSYDDDPVPADLLAEFGIKPVYFVKNENRAELYNYLNEDKSFSIRSVTEYSDAFEFFKILKRNKLDFVASLKMDGVNTKMLYSDGQFVLSLSRGRNGNSFDYTDNSAKIMPERIDGLSGMHKIIGESYVVDEGLPVLRKKYNKPDGYVSGKSSAISMLRIEHDRIDYRYLKTKVFYAEGIAETLDTMFQKLEECGVDVVPHKLIGWEEIPDSLEEFSAWLKENVFNVMHEEGKGIPSDGVVIEVNDLGWLGEEHNQYVSRQLALKFDYWGYGCYKGIIRDIRIEQRRVNKSVRIEIEPVRTRDGNKATVINSFNPSILIDNDLYVGKEVYFERNSGAVNVLIYGDRLKEIEGVADVSDIEAV